MAYTTSQLQTFFTNANAGTAPTAAQTLTLTALANQNAAGTLTDAQALAQTIDLASDITTAVSVETYAFFTGVAPSQAGLAFLNQAYVGTGAQAGLNGENRFIAQSVSLALGNSAAKTAFTTSYGSLSIVDATKAAYNIIVGNAAAAAAGINVDAAVAFLTSAASVDYYTKFVKANVPGIADADVALAVKAAIVGEIMYQATTFNNGAGVGSYATASTNLVKDLADDGALTANNTAGINLFTAYGNSGTGTPGTPGQSFALKVGLDALVGTANDDTFVGSLDALGATATTVNLGDSIDGGAGTDTLTIVSNVTGGAASVSGLTLKSIENVVVNNATAAGAGNLITVDASTMSGVSKISAAGTGNLTVTNIGSATLGVQGTITNGTAGTVAPVVANTIVSQTITAAGATSADVTGTTQNAYGNLLIDVSGGSATSFTLRNTGSTAATVSQLTLATTTATLNVAATSGITLNGTTTNTDASVAQTRSTTNMVVNGGALATVNVTGIGAVNLGSLASTVLKTVDASGSTGGLTVTVDSTALTSVKGSSAADTITTGALLATAVVDMGAGNDTLTLTAAPATGASINGGDGTDTLGLGASAIVTAANKTQFVSFENVAISGTSTYSVNDLSTFGAITVAGGTVVLNDVGANATFNATGTTASLTTNLTSTSGTADTVNLNLGNTAAKANGTISSFVAAGVENLNVVSNVGSSATAANSVTINAADTSLTKVVVSGAGLFTLNTANISHALSIDASANTAGVTVAGGATGFAMNFIGTNANDTFTAGNSGGLINAGKGGDLITLGGGVDTVILKGGDSSLDLTTGVTSGVGGKSAMDTINAFAIGADKIDLTQISGFGTTGQGVATATVGAGDNAGLNTLLATANLFKDGGGLQRGVLDITGYAVDTHFVVIDVNHDGAYTAGTDLVVKLVATGAGNLTAADFNFGS